jgi:hypothetical protein
MSTGIKKEEEEKTPSAPPPRVPLSLVSFMELVATRPIHGNQLFLFHAKPSEGRNMDEY